MDDRMIKLHKSSQKEQKIKENLWLYYFNTVLLNRGIIEESTFKRIQRMILNR